MNWDDFDAFCQVVEHGGFTAASRVLERPKSSLSASVARLESQLGTKLLERTTRQLRLTEEGEFLYRELSKPFAQLREVAADAQGRGERVQGLLRIAAPYEFGAHHLAAVACGLMKAHPALKVQIDVEHARVAIFERHYDIVFSATEEPGLAPSTVVVKRVYSLERGLFASPQLLGAYPDLRGPEDLNGMPLLAGGDDAAWAFSGDQGAGTQIEIRNPPLRSGNAEVRLLAAIEGLGVARIVKTFCAPAVSAGKLIQVIPQWRCAPLLFHALLPGRRLIPAKVRVFLDSLEAGHLARHPPWPDT